MPTDNTTAPITAPTTAPTTPVTAPASQGSGTGTGTKLADVISYAKANPNTPYAQKAMGLIQSGAFDSQATKERLDLSWAGRPALQKTGAENIGDSLQERNKSIAETWDSYKKGDVSLPQAVVNHVGQAIGGAFDIPMGIAKAAFGNPKLDIPMPKQMNDVTDFLSEHLAKPEIATYENAGKLAQKAGDLYMAAHKETDPEAQAKMIALAKEVSNTADLVRSKADQISTSYRENAKSGEATANIGGLALGGAEALAEKGATDGMVKDVITGTMKPTAATTVKEAASTAAGMASKAVKPILDVAKSGVDAVGDTASSIKDAISGKVQSAFKGKTVDEILTTPEDQLHKLSPTDRKVYFDAQRDQVAKNQATVESNIKAASEKKVADLQAETQGLSNQADRASIEEAQSLKPKVIDSMKTNSDTYRELVDKEISQHAGTNVSADELKQFVEKRFAENPEQAKAIQDRMGLTEPAEKAPKAGETPSIQMDATKIPDTTIGKIYQNMKSLKQDIGAAAKKGARTFTADEKMTDDAISTFSDFLKSKGVDLSEANSFWRNYAPMRDKLIKSIQPFTPRGAESGTFKTFTQTIQKSIQGTDEGNKDFISAAEKLLDTKIGNKEVRDALAKLDANKKAQIAAKVDAANAADEARLKADLENEKISKGEFEANRKAQTRTNILSAIKWAIGGGLTIETLKHGL